MLTEDLHEALEHASSRPPFNPSMSAVMARHRQLRLRRRFAAATSVVAVGAVVAGLAIGLSGNPAARHTQPAMPTVGLGGRPVPVTPDELVAAFAQWGPTRGDLRQNSAFTTRVLDAWAKPFTNDPQPWQVFPGPRALTGSPRVLFAGRTPNGVAAVVAQPSHDPHVKLYVGVLVGTSMSRLRVVGEEESDTLSYPSSAVVARENPIVWYHGGEIGGFFGYQPAPDPYVLSFATDADGRNAVILPVDPHDSIEAATGHAISAGGQITRVFSAVPTYGGVATEAVPNDNVTDTIVRVTHRGRPVDQSSVLSDNPFGLATPSNLLPTSDRIDQAAGGKSTGINFANLPYGWMQATYGSPAAPYPSDPFGDRDFVHTTLKHQWYGEIDQEWLPGDPAQTVVTVQNLSRHGGPAMIVSHSVTHPYAQLVVADRLPHSLGWLVLGGNKTTITGYRAPGQTSWVVPAAATTQQYNPHPGPSHTIHVRRAAVLPTNAPTLQIRLRVNGRQVVVTRSS